jgi:hypothetical protein
MSSESLDFPDFQQSVTFKFTADTSDYVIGHGIVVGVGPTFPVLNSSRIVDISHCKTIKLQNPKESCIVVFRNQLLKQSPDEGKEEKEEEEEEEGEKSNTLTESLKKRKMVVSKEETKVLKIPAYLLIMFEEDSDASTFSFIPSEAIKPQDHLMLKDAIKESGHLKAAQWFVWLLNKGEAFENVKLQDKLGFDRERRGTWISKWTGLKTKPIDAMDEFKIVDICPIHCWA